MTFELSDEEGTFLVQLARNTAKTFLETGKIIDPPQNTPKKLFEKCGVFVTINSVRDHASKDLRGCIGYPQPIKPLVHAVIDNAINAATQDPRFEPLEKNELDQVVFEVSALTPPERIKVDNPEEYAKQVKVGEHGLIVEKGFYRGLLLPQVPVEWGWCEEDFLCQCCVKAGLPPDSWLSKNTKVYRFGAIVFEEEKPNGAVKRKSLTDA